MPSTWRSTATNGPAGPFPPAGCVPDGRLAGRVGPGVGPLLAWLSGSSHSLAVAVVLAVFILAYDGGMKRTILGPELMGACRG